MDLPEDCLKQEITKERFRIHGYDPEQLPAKLKALGDFVELFIQKEKEGLRPWVLVNY